MAFSTLKQSINHLLQKTTGYRLTKDSAIPDLRGKVTDLGDAVYQAKTYPFIMDLPFDIGGDWLYARYADLSLSPYYQAAAAALKVIDNSPQQARDEISKVLQHYANLVTIGHPNELLGLSVEESKFNDAKKFYEMVLPWDHQDVLTLSTMRGNNIRNENRRYGLDSDCGLTGTEHIDEKIKIETNRVYDLLLSMRTHGFIESFENMISARVYVYNGQYKWRAASGMHRSAIWAAMGREAIPAIISRIINRSEVAYWPAVKAGYYSQESALKVFDRIFNAAPPPAYSKWQQLVEGSRELG